MKQLTLSNVRSFAGPIRAPLSRLTILVGENSTGKSSFLALERVALEFLNGSSRPNFNKEPFLLGAFDQIAHYHGGKIGRAKTFSIETSVAIPGHTIADIKQDEQASLKAEFHKVGSHPSLSSMEFRYGAHRVQAREGLVENATFSFPDWAGTFPPSLASLFQRMGMSRLDPTFLTFALEMARHQAAPNDGEISQFLKQGSIQQFKHLASAWTFLQHNAGFTPYPIAPIRTKPRRTYDPVDEAPNAEGDHVPMLLAKTKYVDKRRWEKIKSGLDAFGKLSGLYQEINIKSHGRSDSDPFQILVKISGAASNLIDVGYGISQVLPIIVDLIEDRQHREYLLQQPEVHLHPKAQAALGTFLCDIVRHSKQTAFLVETHSDYLIDRIRIEVASGRGLKPADVSILYFERKGRNSYISPLRLDDNGNILGAPPSYRAFFMEEEERLLGI